MHRPYTHLISVAASIFIFTAAPAFALQPSGFQTIALNAGIHVIKAEVAITDAEHHQGLMFREKMGANDGMVFLFDKPAAICMWMKNTLLPLSVAFIDDNGAIINIDDMAPQTTDSHCAKKPARYALEMNKDWFKQKNLKPGSRIDGLPRMKY